MPPTERRPCKRSRARPSSPRTTLHEPFPAHRLSDTARRIEWHARAAWPVAIGQVEGSDRSYVIEGMRAHLARWLFDASAEFHWYRAAPLAAGNCAVLAGKARSILQEICLSARLDSLSTAFLDVKGLRRWQRLALPVLESRIRRRAAALHR